MGADAEVYRQGAPIVLTGAMLDTMTHGSDLARATEWAALNLDGPELRVFLYAYLHRDKKGLFSQVQSHVAETLRVSVKTVNRAVAELKRQGALVPVAETPRATVYRVAIPGDSQEGQNGDRAGPDEAPFFRSDKIGYVKLDRSLIPDPSATEDHSVAAGEVSNAQSAPSVRRVLATPHDSSAKSVPSVAPVRPAMTDDPPGSVKSVRSVNPPHTPPLLIQENTAAAGGVPSSVEGGGGGGGSRDDTGEKLLAGMRNQSRARALAAKHSAAEIREALALASKIKRCDDVLGMAAQLLDSGAAAKSLADRTATRDAAQEGERARQDEAARVLTEQAAQQRKRADDAERIHSTDTDTLRAALAEVIPTVKYEAHRVKLQRDFTSANGTRAAVITLALCSTLRPAVAERILVIKSGAPRVVPETAA